MKNLDVAIELISNLPNATLDIYGPISQTDYWASCRAQIATSGKPEAFAYRGSILATDVLSTLSAYDLFILPSQSESFGYAILESMAAGCPVLISDRTQWRNLQEAGVGADVSLERNDLSRAFLRYVRDLDEQVHREMRENARRYALTYVRNSSAKEAMRNVYAAALQGSAAGPA